MTHDRPLKGGFSLCELIWSFHGCSSSLLALARRWIELIAPFFPQRYQVVRTKGDQPLATFRQHFNPFIFKMSVAIHAQDEQFDDLLFLAAACLITAIEGRQS